MSVPPPLSMSCALWVVRRPLRESISLSALRSFAAVRFLPCSSRWILVITDGCLLSRRAARCRSAGESARLARMALASACCSRCLAAVDFLRHQTFSTRPCFVFSRGFLRALRWPLFAPLRLRAPLERRLRLATTLFEMRLTRRFFAGAFLAPLRRLDDLRALLLRDFFAAAMSPTLPEPRRAREGPRRDREGCGPADRRRDEPREPRRSRDRRARGDP